MDYGWWMDDRRQELMTLLARISIFFSHWAFQGFGIGIGLCNMKSVH
jgi:hypothetical protein